MDMSDSTSLSQLTLVLLVLLSINGTGKLPLNHFCIVKHARCIVTGQTSSFEPVFVEEPGPFIQVEINTTINLFWRIKYDTCATGGSQGCFRVSIFTSGDRRLYHSAEPVISNNFLYDAATSIISDDSATSYADVRFIAFIDEYVFDNVPFFECRTSLSKEGNTHYNYSTVHIAVTNQPVSTTVISSDTISCNSTVACCSELYLKLMLLFQVLFMSALYS